MTKLQDLKYSKNSSQANLWQFKSVIETGDLRYLLKLSDYTELPEVDVSELETVWQDIYQEFSDIAGGNQADMWLLKVKRLTSMQLDYQRHMSILNLVKLMPESMIEIAREEGYMIEIDDFAKTFEKAYTRLMRMKNQIGIFQKDQEREETKEDSLDDLIVTLEKWQGYQFDEYRMSVKKFANIYKKYKDGQAT